MLLLFLLIDAATFSALGFVVSFLWGMFVTPLGVDAISVPQAIGISVMTALVTRQTRKIEDIPDYGEFALLKLLTIAFAAGIGFIASLFMP